MKNKLFGLLLGDGEREKLHELCVREGIPITFPELFDKDAPMKYMWTFDMYGIGGAGTIVMRHLKADGIPIIHGVKELEEFFSSEIWAEHKLMMAKEVYVVIKTKEDEEKWKSFLSHYFPNHYASGLLKDDLLRDRIAVSLSGYGYLSLLCCCYGNYFEVEDFERFKETKVYKDIVNRGVSLDVGEPSVVHIKVK